jgi:tol-pal system protein YbgF
MALNIPARCPWLAALALAAALAAAVGCGSKDEVARDEFDVLTGRVGKLEDTVYRGGQIGGPGAAAIGPGGAAVAYGPGGPASSSFESALGSGAASQPKASGSERTRYNRAHALLKQKKYAQAAQAFADMLRDNPRGALAPNARYWLGECRYAAGDFQGALVEFRQGLADYPSSNKAPDCLLKISYCQSRLGDGPGAMRSLSQLLASYPDSPSAQLVKSGRTRFTSQ